MVEVANPIPNPEILPTSQRALRLKIPAGQMYSGVFEYPFVYRATQLYFRHFHPLRVERIGMLSSSAREILGADWLPCRVLYAGVCGSDRHVVHFDVDPHTISEFPNTEPEHANAVVDVSRKVLPNGQRTGRIITDKTLGHEIVVEYDEDGRKKIGMVYPILSCMTKFEEKDFCQPCQNHQENGCENIQKGKVRGRAQGLGAVVVNDGGKIEGELGGGFGEWIWVHKKQIIPLPESLDLRLGVLADSIASAGNAFKLIENEIKASQDPPSILVIGMGAVGFGMMHYLAMNKITSATFLVKHEYQADIIHRYVDSFNTKNNSKLDYKTVVAERNPHYLQSLAPDNKPECVTRSKVIYRKGVFDIILDCVGNEESISDTWNLLKWNGKAVQVGLPSHDDSSPFPKQVKQGESIPSFWADRATFEEAVNIYLPSIPIAVMDLIDVNHPLEDFERVFYPQDKTTMPVIKQGFRVGVRP